MNDINFVYILNKNDPNVNIVINPNNNNDILMDKGEFESFIKFIDTRNYKEIDDKLFQKILSQNLLNNYKIKHELNEERNVVYMVLTNLCNYNCIYCYAKMHNDFQTDNKTLSYLEGVTIIDNIIKAKYKNIIFTGGEPMLCECVFDLASYAKRKGLVVGLLTNAKLVNKENIMKLNRFHYVQISLDSHVPDINDKTRGKGHLTKTLEALQLLSNHNISIFINSVVTKYNYDSLIDTMKFLRERYNIIEHVYSFYSPYNKINLPDLYLTLEEKIKTIKDYYVYLINNKTNAVNLWQNNNSVSTICAMGASEICINPYGEVYPCRLLCTKETKMGNALDDDLTLIIDQFYREDFLKKFCVDNISDCKKCSYKYLCGGGCRPSHIAYSEDVNISYKDYCKVWECNYIISKLLKHSIFDWDEKKYLLTNKLNYSQSKQNYI